MPYPTTKTHRKAGRVMRYFKNPDDYNDEGTQVLMHYMTGTDVLIEHEDGVLEFVNAYHVVA